MQNDINDLPDILSWIDPDCSREEWIKVLTGVKSEFGDNGYDDARDWSADGDENFKDASFKAVWKSLSAGSVGFGTVVWMAKNEGYEPPRRDESTRKNPVKFERKIPEEPEPLSKEVIEKRKYAISMDLKGSQPAATAPRFMHYMMWRGIPLSIHDASPHVHFKEETYYPLPKGNTTQPALLCEFWRDGKFLSLQNTFLDRETPDKAVMNCPETGEELNVKVFKKSPHEDDSLKGGFIPLSAMSDLMEAEDWFITEGMETGYAVKSVYGMDGIATTSASFMKNVRLPPRDRFPNTAKRVFIFADLDAQRITKSGNVSGEAGQKAAYELAERLREQGREVYILVPNFKLKVIDARDESTKDFVKGVDWLDVLVKKGVTYFPDLEEVVQNARSQNVA